MRSRSKLLLFLAALFFLTGCSRDVTKLPDTYKSDLIDGNYTVTSKHYDPFGYGLTLNMTVTDQIVTQINLTETGKDGKDRLSEKKSVRWEGCDESLATILQGFYSQIIKSQKADIDAVSGATETSQSMSVLSKTIFENAKDGLEKDTTDAFKWTYEAQNDPDEVTGSQEVLKVTYEDGKIVEVTCEEVKKTTALYAIGLTYAGFAQQTQKSGELTPVTSDTYPSRADRYNELLEQIKQQRTAFKP